MGEVRVLVAGESWLTASTHFKGWDFYSSTTYHTGIGHLQSVLGRAGIELVHMPSHVAATDFPLTAEACREYQVIVLSDIGSNTLLLHPDTWLQGKRMPNRLRLLADFVRSGGGLAMAGGYYSFAGIQGAAHYHKSPVEEVLPVDILPYDDRAEVPEGFRVEVTEPGHPILAGMGAVWPELLGYNRLRAKSDAQVLVVYEGDPILTIRSVGRGRTLAWASDIGPHWCPEAFLTWAGYERLWVQSIYWLAGTRLNA